MLGLPNAFGIQDWIEENAPQKIQPAVLVVADGYIRCEHADLVDACLPQFGMNFTSEPLVDNTLHGTGVASAMIAKVNNQISAVGLGGYRNRVQFVPDKIANADGSTNSNLMRLAYQHAFDLKVTNHLNIVGVVVAAGGFGDSNQAESLRLIRLLASQKIALIVAAGFNGVDLDNAPLKLYPAAYAATEPNVLTVAAHDENGNLLPESPFGKNTVAIAALGKNVQVINPNDPTNNSTGSMSNTSPAAGQAGGAYAVVWAYKTHQMAKALRRIKRGGQGSIPGVQFGTLNLEHALGEFPVNLLVTDNNRLWGLDSVTHRAEAIPGDSVFFPDHRNRLMLFCENLDEPLAAADLSVQLRDSTGKTITLVPEFVGELSGWEWITQVNIKLPPVPTDLAAGEIQIKVTARGQTSTALFSLR
jgi:hypothetical protein